MNERREYIKVGRKASKRGDRAIASSCKYDSYWTQPCNKYWKRQANKKVRCSNIINNMGYKRIYDSFYWS